MDTASSFSHYPIRLTHDKFIVQIHGGAWDIPAALQEDHRIGVKHAYWRAVELLEKGVPPLEVVVEALESMENDPIFDAGKGSFLNENGEVELDAAVMEGIHLRAGAVACVGSFANPSRIALAVQQHTEHVLLVGKGAEAFALSRGFHMVEPHTLVHPREINVFEEWVRAGKPDAKIFFAKPTNFSQAGSAPDRRGTVGVVIGVRTKQGTYDVFAGTSTGGTPGKKAGRVGDVPLVGCGVYADNEGAAVSCTGWGEGLIRVAAAKAVSERVRCGQHPQEAVEAVLADLWRRTEGRGGIIALDTQGRCGAAFSTPDMAFAGGSAMCIYGRFQP